MAASETAATPDTLGRRSVLLVTLSSVPKPQPYARILDLGRTFRERPSLDPFVVRQLQLFLGIFGWAEGGTMLAKLLGMAPRRAHRAAIAAASDGSVLINVVELLPEDVQERLGEALGTTQLFIGVPLKQREAADVVARLDDAAAEASARLLGGRVLATPPAVSKPRRRAAAKPAPKRSKRR
jgi:hypothetical protein